MGSGRPLRRVFRHLQRRSSSTASIPVSSSDGVVQILASLKQCRDLAAARDIHASAARSNHLGRVFVANNLMSVFLRCGSVDDARTVFEAMPNRNAVSWNTMIVGYASAGEDERALEIFREMVSKGVRPTSRTYIGGLQALSGRAERSSGDLVGDRAVKLEILEKVMDLHSQASKNNEMANDFLANTLIDTYSKCGSLLDARIVFDGMDHHDVVSLTSMVVASVENGEAEFGLGLFEAMIMDSNSDSNSLRADARCFAAALKACSILSAVESGKKIHDEISKRGLSRDGFLCNSLLDFYAKCGIMDDALEIFRSMSSGARNLVTWSSLIAGYGRIGDGGRVIEIFQRMREEGVVPDDITFLSLLRACAHGGLVENAKEFFAAMVSQYGIRPGIEHYHAMIDILGQANLLEEAAAMAEGMPVDATAVTWNTVLGACWKWKNVEVAKLAFESSLRLDPAQGLAYVLMANVYRSAGMWEEHRKIIDMKNDVQR